LEVLKSFREEVRRKRPELFANKTWYLHHDNAPAHMALSVREVLATELITVWNTLPIHRIYSPLTFFLFQKLKEILKVMRFDYIDDIGSNTTIALKAILQN
jgi:hypothetical protein